MRPFHLLAFLVFFSETSGFVLSRNKRQTSVGSNAETNGDGDQVLTDASTAHFKTSDGSGGMNVTTIGNSSGIGSSSIGNSAGGHVGNTSVENVANVLSVGDKANSFSDIFAAVQGENISMNVVQQGKVAGQGATLSNVNGGSTLQNKNGEKKSGFSYGNAGGTGSINTEAEINTNQMITWEQLVAKLAGSAAAQGLGSAQSNVDLGTGVNDNNMTISGLVSGLNSNNGQVNALVTGNGTLNGTDRNVQGMMVGSVVGKGNSTIVGASSIDNNQTSSSEIQAFGNSNAYSNGNSSVNLMSNTNIENDNGLGVVHISGKGQGSNNFVVASNGLKIMNSQEDSAFIGTGSIKGTGSDANSSAYQSIDTAVDSNGLLKIQSQSSGQSLSNDGTNSSLNFNANGLVGGWQNTSFSVLANGLGLANGANNNVFGSGFVDIEGDFQNGNSSMTAHAAGPGPSAVKTSAALAVDENGQFTNKTVSGNASGRGNETDVDSYSLVSNDQGIETLSNIQHVKSSGSGVSSVSASSSSIFKRKKRFSLLEGILKE